MRRCKGEPMANTTMKNNGYSAIQEFELMALWVGA
jgi:hypothetical protein